MTTQHSYENEKIRVSFDGRKCTHVGFCFKELGAVFDGDRNPPIDLDGAPHEEIIAMVEKCPSSALIYERLDGEKNEAAPKQTSATLIPNGPLAIRGELGLNGESYARLTLCRCGHSQQKPFCDGAHNHHQFDDGNTINIEPTSNETCSVNFTPHPNGPVLFKGNMAFQSIEGLAICSKKQGAICCCGASKTKPFCDGSHLNIKFSTENTA
jgi:CDGSH-type Zn-finger protein/uncharacterized Fe-S cluster protein YjdI